MKTRSLRTPEAGAFLVMDRAKASAAKNGQQLVDLSVGSSDLQPPPEALEAIRVGFLSTRHWVFRQALELGLLHVSSTLNRSCQHQPTAAHDRLVRVWHYLQWAMTYASNATVVPAAGIVEGPCCSQVLLEIWHHATAAGSCRLVSATPLQETTSQFFSKSLSV